MFRLFPSVDFNNIVLKHRGHTISMASHFTNDKETDREILVWGPHVDDERFVLPADLQFVIAELNAIREYIDNAINEANGNDG